MTAAHCSAQYRADSAFLRSGFAVLPRLLDGSELPPVRSAVERLLSGPLPPGCERPYNTLAPLRWDDPLVATVLRDRVVRAIADAVDARDLRWISAYVSSKDRRSPPLWWHQDWWCWQHPVTYRRRASQVAVLIYLSDTDPAKGALRLLPGSHQRSVPLHAALPGAHRRPEAVRPDDEVMQDQSDQTTLALGAGDAAVIDYRLLHGTHANESGVRRDCLVFNFAPEWSALPRELKAHLIRHPALPSAEERDRAPSWLREVLPTFAGTPRDLDLQRDAPVAFAIEAGQH